MSEPRVPAFALARKMGGAGLPPLARIPLLLLGFLSLAVGMAGGLTRAGFHLPVFFPGAAAHHAELMVGGFFGTVICLERAVALRAKWAFAAPLAAATGALVTAMGHESEGIALVLGGSFLLSLASIAVWLRQPAFFTAVLAAGAACWTAGNLLRLQGAPVMLAVPWWIAFFVLTIAGERLELNRLLRPKPHALAAFALVLAMLVAACYLLTSQAEGAAPLFGAALAAMGVWLAVNDVARRTVKGLGLPRYIAISLLSGYFWLVTGGWLVALPGALAGFGPAYDAALHAVLIGFVFSMVLGHAPIILPAVLRISVPYTAWFYVPLALLHASLIVRLSGDLGGWPQWRLAGSIGNTAAVLLFILSMAGAVLVNRFAKPVPLHTGTR